jgi:enoyl-CoA hydratase
MSSETIILETPAAHVALIRLNRADKHNAINTQMAEELVSALDALEIDEAVRVVVLTGAGEKAFCAGADMAEAVETMSAGGRRDKPAIAAMRLRKCTKPVIAAVNGYAYGGGALFAANCDVRICSENARFRFVGASYGLVVGASQLARIVGAPMAKELIFTARTIDADEALRIGLVNHVVPLDELESRVLETSVAIAQNSPAAVRASKHVIDLATSTKDAAKAEVEYNLLLREADEHKQRFREATERVTGQS